jgi:hypothetical protein
MRGQEYSILFGRKRINERRRREGKVMRKGISLLVVLGITAVGIGYPIGAQAVEEEVVIFRSLVDPDVPAPEYAWCVANAPSPLTLTTIILPAGASFWSLQTRASDGSIVEDTIRQVGTGQVCGYVDLLGGLDPGASNPYYFEGTVGGLELAAGGECILSTNNVPADNHFLQTCILSIPDGEQGLLGGLITMNSMNPIGPPDLGIIPGSIWTLRVYWEE